MLSLRDSVNIIMDESHDQTVLEKFIIENPGLLADVILEMLDDDGIDITALDNDDFLEECIDYAIQVADSELNEGLIGNAMGKVKSYFTRDIKSFVPKKPDAPNTDAPQIARPHPSRVQPRPETSAAPSITRPNPKRTAAIAQAKAEVKKRVQHGHAAKKDFKGQIKSAGGSFMQNHDGSEAKHTSRSRVNKSGNRVTTHYAHIKGEDGQVKKTAVGYTEHHADGTRTHTKEKSIA